MRKTIAHPEATTIAAHLRAAAEAGALASAQSTAAEIWQRVLGELDHAW